MAWVDHIRVSGRLVGLCRGLGSSRWIRLNDVCRKLRLKKQTRRALLVATTCVVGFAALNYSALAQESRPLLVEDAVRLHYFGELSPLAFSPDGERLAYVVKDNQK